VIAINEVRPKKKMMWYTQQLQDRVVSRSRSQNLATQVH